MRSIKLLAFLYGAVLLPLQATTTISILNTTPTQAIIQVVTNQAGNCTYAISEGNNPNGVQVNDVNTTLYAGSNSDARAGSIITGTGTTTHIFVAGTRTSAVASSGAVNSRALQAYTAHAVQATCGSDAPVVTTLITQDIPFNNLYGETPQYGTGSGVFGNHPLPTINWSNQAQQRIIDPMTGILIRPVTTPNSNIMAQSSMTALNPGYALDIAGSVWSNPQNVVTNHVPSLLATTATTGFANRLFVPIAQLSPSAANIYYSGGTALDLLIRVYGYGAGSPVLGLCLTVNSLTCDTPQQTVAITTSIAETDFPAAGTSSLPYPTPMFAGWGSQTIPLNSALIGGTVTPSRTATLTTSGGSSTLSSPTGQPFVADWPIGSKIALSGTGVTCPIATITSVTTTTITVAENCGTSSAATVNLYNFGVMVWLQSGASANVSLTYDTIVGAQYSGGQGANIDSCNFNSIVNINTDANGVAITPSQTGYLCSFVQSLYLFIPQLSATPPTYVSSGLPANVYEGESRLLSSYACQASYPNCAGLTGNFQVFQSPFSNSDPYTLFSTAENNHIYKGVYTPSSPGVYTTYNPGNVIPSAPDNIVWTDLSATTTPIATQLASLPSTVPSATYAANAYATGLFPAIAGVNVIDGYTYYNTAIADESGCIIMHATTGTNQLIQAYTSWDHYPLRWGACHFQPLGIGQYAQAVVNQAAGFTGTLNGPWVLDIVDMNHNGTRVAYSQPITAATNTAGKMFSAAYIVPQSHTYTSNGTTATFPFNVTPNILTGQTVYVNSSGNPAIAGAYTATVTASTLTNPATITIPYTGNAPAWNNSTPYTVGTYVSIGTTNYICIAPNTNQTPPNATYWTSTGGNVSYNDTTIQISQLPLITSLVTNGTIGTITTPQAHGLSTGQTIYLWDPFSPFVGGTYTITVTSSTTFTYPFTGAAASYATSQLGFCTAPRFTSTGISLDPFYNFNFSVGSHIGPRVTITGFTGAWAGANNTWNVDVAQGDSNGFLIPQLNTSGWGAMTGTPVVQTAPPLISSNVVNITNATPPTVTTTQPLGPTTSPLNYGTEINNNRLLNADSVVFANNGVTSGQFFVKVLTTTTFQVYLDQALSMAATAADVTPYSGGTVLFSEQCPGGLPTFLTSGLLYDNGGAVGPRCVTFNVATQPRDYWATAAIAASYPCSPVTAGCSTLQNVVLGDDTNDIARAQTNEKLTLVQTANNGDGTIAMTFMRNYGASYLGGLSPAGDSIGSTHDAGWTPRMIPPFTIDGAEGFMNVLDTTATFAPINPEFAGAHGDFGWGDAPGLVTYAMGDVDPINNVTISGLTMAAVTQTTSIQCQCPLWPGTSASSLTGPFESYPGHRQYGATFAEMAPKQDWNALLPDSGTTESWAPGANPTLVGGYTNTYLISNVGGTTNYKLIPLTGWAGSRYLGDISGPSSVIRDSTLDSFCYVYTAGECISGSTVGQIYVSGKGFALDVGGYCIIGNYNDPEPCVTSMGPKAGYAEQWRINPPDTTSSSLRKLTLGLTFPGGHFPFQTWLSSPSLSGNGITNTQLWGFFVAPFVNGLRTDYYAMKLPAYPASTFTYPNTGFYYQAATITSPPVGTVYARFQFGYAEFGPVTSFDCTKRGEACNTDIPTAVGHTTDPFSFASEASTHIACASTCTINIPILPDHVVYYQAQYLNSGGTVIGTGNMQVAATVIGSSPPPPPSTATYLRGRIKGAIVH